LNNFSPLPEINEPLLKNIEPLNVEPLASEVTTKPSSGETDAVTATLIIKLVSKAS